MSILFTNNDNETDGGLLELDGASFITSADVGGTTYVFIAGGVDNGVSVFALGLNGALTNTANITDSGALNLAGVSGLTTITSNGNTYLVAAGAGDNGLSVFRVSVGGALTPVYDVADAGALNLGGVSRVASATVSGNAYVFAAGTNDNGISVFRVAGDGRLTPTYDLGDNGTLELGGVKGMTTAVIGGNTFLFAAGGVDDGVSVFNVAANGTLINTSNVTDDATLKLDGASDVTTAVVAGVTYLFATGSADNGVSVFSVNTSGVLTNVANVTDTAALRLAGATGVTTSVFGATTYLTVGGTENGVSIFKVNPGGSLTWVDNIDDAGGRELGGVTQVHTASVGGTNYVIAAGATDDGVSVFGTHPTGQLWYLTQGNPTDARLVRVNSDGLGHTVLFDNDPTVDLGTSFPQDVVMDTAAGVYYVLSDGGDGSNARILMGHIGSSTPPTTVRTFNTNDDLVNALHIDAVNQKLYVSYLSIGADFGDTTQGIKVFDYDTTTGALTNEHYLVTQATAQVDPSAPDGTGYLAARDFDVDAGRGYMYFTNQLLGDGAESNMVYRLDLNNPSSPAVPLAPQAQFPLDGDSSEFITLNGIIQDIEIDADSDRAYFLTHAEETSDPAAENAIWMVAGASTTTGSTNAVKVTLVGVNANDFYPGDMALDEANNILYIESENVVDGGVNDDDVILVFQLNAAGTTATLINTITPGFGTTANIGGMTFNQLAVLSGLNGTASQIGEQVSAATVLLTGAPTITDAEGDHLAGATVQITGGRFSSNESSNSDDHLGYGAGKQISGLIAGYNITVSWDSATETLTLSGYDTIANYQAVLSAITFWSTGDNPTNYGLNTNRIITWTVSDGTPDVPGGSINSGTTTINIAAVNDAPINGVVTSATGNEDAAAISITGLQISDADANPAIQTMSVTLSVTKGVLTLLTNVANGLTSGEITGNGTSTVTISGTLNEINATLAATNGLLFTGNANVNGTDTLTVVTNDGGGTGSGGDLSDTNLYTITMNAVNDAPVVIGDGTESLVATNEDVANLALTNTVSALFGGQYDDSADQVSGGSSANAFAGVAIIANGSSAATGQWQYYNGSTWANIGAASTAAAVTIAAGAPLRFLPATDYNGEAPTLTVKLIDASGGALTNGAVVNVTTSGGSTPYSVGTVVLGHSVTAINDAPVTVGGAAVALTTIGEDSAPGAGQTVSALFASHFSDAKDQVSGGSSANALIGIAITSNTATAAQGVYQYFEGGVWQDLPAVSASSAFILDASTLVRFVPAADYSGTPPTLIVHMIEDSAGAVTTGATADLTTTGGSTQYGTGMTLGVTVTPINDAPVATGAATLAAVNEDTAAPGGQTVSTMFGSHFTDADGGEILAGVAITGNAATSQGVWQYFNGVWITIGSPSEGAALVLAGGTLVRFLPAANYNGATPALTAYLIDSSGGAVTTGSLLDVSVNGGQTRFSDVSIDLTTTITAVNDTPVVPATATTVGATEQTAATLLGSVTVSDVDLGNRNSGNGDFGGASFTVQRGSANAQDTFAFGSGGLFTVSGGDLQVGGLTFATFSSVGGVLTISFTSTAATATTALVNDVINHIRYTNSSDTPPSSVTLNYVLNDGSPGGGQGTGGTASAGGSVIVNIIAVNDPHTGGASVTGTAAEDNVLTAVSTLVDPDGIGTLHYQWQHDVGGGYVNVGADQSTYTLGDGDIGGVVRVVIYYTDAGGTVESATSAATAAIGATNDAPTGGAAITGTATEDQVLTADTSTLADSDGLGTLHYQWQRDTGSGFVNVGTDQSTYTLGDADVGGVVRVVVSYTDGQGFANSVTSAASAAIAGVNDAPTGGASITGTTTEDQVLTADTSTLADVDGLGTLHYQWQRDTGSGFVNVGTDQATYTLAQADVGGVIRVVVSYTDQLGTAEAVTSAGTAIIAEANTAPVITGFNDTPTFTEGGAAVVLDDDASLSDTQMDLANYGGATLVLQRSGGANADDLFGDSGLLELTVGGDVMFNGVLAGAYTQAGGVLTITFDAAVDAGIANEVLRALTYANLNDLPPASATIALTFTDDGGLATTRNLTVTLVGDAVQHGGSGADVLTTTPQNPTLAGGDGDDRYYVSQPGDAVVENGGEGIDNVYATFTYRLDSNVENLTLRGSADLNGYGNELDNIIVGNSGVNSLVGGAGADRMKGGAGDDVYYVDNAGDRVIEAANEGFDHVRTIISYALSDNVEKLTLAGSAAINGVGNGLDNVMVGNAAKNTLNGLTGADTMAGGAGNDTYYVDNVGDRVAEALNAGTDEVQSTVSFSLGANVERLLLGGALAINGTGNILANTIVGNGAANVITGGGGRDILTGGTGADTFDFNSLNDSTLAASDRITDLTNADIIDLSTIDANSLQVGNQDFVLVDAFSSQAGQVILTYSSANDFTVLAADVNGDGVADFRVVLNGDHDDFTNFIF